MKKNRFAFYRERIGETQEKISEVLNIPLDIYIEFEENKREPSQQVKDAFYGLLTRFPGSTSLSKLRIQAIYAYKKSYQAKTGGYPSGKHWIPFSFATSKRTLVDFSPYDDDLDKGVIKTEKEI